MFQMGWFNHHLASGWKMDHESMNEMPSKHFNLGRFLLKFPGNSGTRHERIPGNLMLLFVFVFFSGKEKNLATKIIPARDPKQCENKNKMQCMCDHSM